MNNTRKRLVLSIIFLMSTCLISCNGNNEDEKSIVFTIGLIGDEILKVGDEGCELSEALVYYATMKNDYEQDFGEGFFDSQEETSKLKEKLSEIAVSRVVQIKIMNIIARDMGIELSAEEVLKVEQLSEEFFEGLAEDEILALKVELGTVTTMYTEYALANKLYDETIADIDYEISDDAARSVTVNRMIFDSEFVDYEVVLSAFESIGLGEDFIRVAAETENTTLTQSSFAMDDEDIDKAVKEAAFDLAVGECSSVIITETGYEIIECVDSINRDETEVNKQNMIEKMQNDKFNDIYVEYAKDLIEYRDDDLWRRSVDNLDDCVKTREFFRLYNEKF